MKTVLPDNLARILAVTIGGLGDAILFSPVLKALRKRYPQAQITLLCASPLVNEAYSICKEIDYCAIVNTKQKNIIAKVSRFLSYSLRSRISGGYDIGVFATGLNKHLSYLLKLTAGVQRIYRAPSFPSYRTDLICNVQLARIFDKGISENDVFIGSNDNSLVKNNSVYPYSQTALTSIKFIAVYPSTDLLHRPRWELNKLIQVIRELKRNGFDGKFVLVGSSEEGREWDSIDTDGVVDLNFAGKLTLPEIAELLKNASLVIGNDGGLIHVAGSAGCPLVAIMPNSPAHYHPAGNNTKVIRSNHKCCHGRYPKRPASCETAICTQDISIEHVVKTCQDFI